jgi:hypothetical protein
MQATDKPRYQKQFKLYKCEQGDKCPDWK